MFLMLIKLAPRRLGELCWFRWHKTKLVRDSYDAKFHAGDKKAKSWIISLINWETLEASSFRIRRWFDYGWHHLFKHLPRLRTSSEEIFTLHRPALSFSSRALCYL